MSSSALYVPVLKWRQGEYKALKHLADDVRPLLLPLIEIPPIAWDFVEEQPQKDLATHLRPMPSLFADHWRDRCWIDFRYVLPEAMPTEQLNESKPAEVASLLLEFFGELRRLKVQGVPGTAPSRDAAFQDAVREIAHEQDTGACIRLRLEDAITPGSLSTIRLVLGLSAAQTDVVVDLQKVELAQISLLRIVLRSVIADLSNQGYRSLALVGSSLPLDLSEVTPGIGSIPRSEWNLWTQLQFELGYSMLFGDYAISHVDVREIDPRVMVASASIRYTTQAEWLIFRGRSLKEIRFGGYNQFRALSNQVIDHPAYSGVRFSWGDEYLYRCAHSLVGTGNVTIWRQVSTNHHITFVTRQIATLRETSKLHE